MLSRIHAERAGIALSCCWRIYESFGDFVGRGIVRRFDSELFLSNQQKRRIVVGNGNHDDSNKRQYFKLVQLDRRICSRFVPRQSTNEQRHLFRLVNVGNVLS